MGCDESIFHLAPFKAETLFHFLDVVMFFVFGLSAYLSSFIFSLIVLLVYIKTVREKNAKAASMSTSWRGFGSITHSNWIGKFLLNQCQNLFFNRIFCDSFCTTNSLCVRAFRPVGDNNAGMSPESATKHFFKKLNSIDCTFLWESCFTIDHYWK